MKECCKYWRDSRLMINNTKPPPINLQGPVKYCPVCGQNMEELDKKTFRVFTTEHWRHDVTAKNFDEAYDKVHNQSEWDKKTLEDLTTIKIIAGE